MPGLDSRRIVVRQTDVLCDFIGRFEANAANVLNQLVGRVLHHCQRFITVLFVNFDGQIGRDVVRLEKQHHIFDGALFFPCDLNAFSPLFANAEHQFELLWLVIDHVQAYLRQNDRQCARP